MLSPRGRLKKVEPHDAKLAGVPTSHRAGVPTSHLAGVPTSHLAGVPGEGC